MRQGTAPPACATSKRIFGSCLNTPASQGFAIAAVVSNGKPAIGPSAYSVKASAAARDHRMNEHAEIASIRLLEERAI
jgi:hypothetical protein